MGSIEKHERFVDEEKFEPSSLLVNTQQDVPLQKSTFKNLFNLEESIGLDPLSASRSTIVIPTLNEENNIKILIKQLHDLGYSDILVIDGNSDDGTVEIAKSLGVSVVNQEGKGKGAALRQAFEYDQLGDWVVMMDADGSMDPKEIPSLVNTLRNGADVAKASRFMLGGRSEDMTFIRRMGNRFFVFLVNRLIKANYTDLCYGYAAFTKEALRKLSPHLKSTSFEIETEIFMKAKMLGLSIEEIPSVEFCRINGKTNLSASKDGYRILKTILSEASHKPDFP